MPKAVEFEGTLHEFPDDFSDAEIASALKNVPTQAAVAHMDVQAAAQPAPSIGFGRSALDLLGRGAKSITDAAVDVGGALYGVAAGGLQNYANAARSALPAVQSFQINYLPGGETIARASKALAEPQIGALESVADFARTAQTEGAESLKETLATPSQALIAPEQEGKLLPKIAENIGPLVTTVAGALFAGPAGAISSGYLSEFQDSFQRYMRLNEDKDPDKAFEAATAAAAMKAPLEAIGSIPVAKGIGAAWKAFRGTAKVAPTIAKAAGKVALGTGAEGLTEWTQAFADQKVEDWYDYPNRTPEQARAKERFDSFVIGMILGGGINTVSGAVEYAADKAKLKLDPETKSKVEADIETQLRAVPPEEAAAMDERAAVEANNVLQFPVQVEPGAPKFPLIHPESPLGKAARSLLGEGVVTPPLTPPPNATQEGTQPESGIIQYPRVDELGQATPTGRSDSLETGGQVPQEQPQPQAVNPHDYIPAIMVEGELVPGNPGDTHLDILNRFIAANPEKEGVARAGFDLKDENPNFFLRGKEEVSREQLKEQLGVSDSQRLRELQAKTPRPPKSPGPGAGDIGEVPTPGTMAAYNAAVDEQRAARGLEPLMSEAAKPDPVTWDNAVAAIEADEMLPERLTQSINSGTKKSVTDEEQTVLLWRMVDLTNKRQMATDRATDMSLPEEDRIAAAAEREIHERALQETEAADRKIGTALGRGLRIRQMLAADDYTFAGMMRNARLDKQGPTTPEEEAKIQKLSEEGTKARTGLQKREAELEEAASTEAGKSAVAEQVRRITPLDKRILDYAEKLVKGWETAADKAWTRIQNKLKVSPSGVDPTILADVVVIARARIGRGVKTFADFTAEMVGRAGEGIRAYLQPAWDAAQAEVDAIGSELPAKERRKVQRKLKAAQTKDGIVAGIAGASDEGAQLGGEMDKYVKKLANHYIENGMRDYNEVVNAVVADLQPILPGVTFRQVSDAFSDYGKSKPAPTDPVKVAKSQIRAELQAVSALEDIEKLRKAPSATGQQRVAPSDIRRRLSQKITEAKKRFNIQPTDPARALKSALDIRKTYYRNRLTDLRFEIESRQKTVRTPSAPPTDPELDAIIAEYQQVKAENEAIFAKDRTPEEQLALLVQTAKTAAERSEARVAAGEYRPKQKGVQPLSSPELEALRSRRDAANAELAMMRDLDTAFQEERTLAAIERQIAAVGQAPKSKLQGPETKAIADARKRLAEAREAVALSRDLVALNQFKARALARIADRKRRMFEGDFETKKRAPIDISKDAEAVRLRALDEAVKKEFEQMRAQWRRNNRSRGQKFVDFVAEFFGSSRQLITSIDVSAPFRQGAVFSLGDLVFNPKRLGKQLGRMFAVGASEKSFERLEAQKAIRREANNRLYDRAGLYLSDIDGKFTNREENMRSNLAEKLPPVRMSNRAYAGFLDQQRMDAFDSFVNMMGGPDAVTEEQAQFLAKSVNDMTGRSDLSGRHVGTMDFLARFLFSPRFLLSRIKLLLGAPVWRGILRGEPVGAKARAIIAMQYGKTLAGLAAFMGLAALAGADIDFEDPKSTDFLKVRFGNTRLDPMFGVQQLAVFLGRAFTGKRTRQSGKEEEVDFTLFGNLLRSKLAPIPASFVDLSLRKHYDGTPVTAQSIALRNTVPISWQEIDELYEQQGVERGTALQMLNLLGMGLQTYEPKPPKKTRSGTSVARDVYGR